MTLSQRKLSILAEDWNCWLQLAGEQAVMDGDDGIAEAGTWAEMEGEGKAVRRVQGWSKLPADVKEAVLRLLPLLQRFQFRLVCREWCRLLSDSKFLMRSTAFQDASAYRLMCAVHPLRREFTRARRFDPFSGKWQVMPTLPSKFCRFEVFSADKGLLVAGSSWRIFVRDLLLQLCRFLSPAISNAKIPWMSAAYVQLAVNAETMSYKVFWFPSPVSYGRSCLVIWGLRKMTSAGCRFMTLHPPLGPCFPASLYATMLGKGLADSMSTLHGPRWCHLVPNISTSGPSCKLCGFLH